jgi:tetratricopeptide (TPR) repeat protein
MLARRRRFDEAFERIRTAQELDPLSLIINQDVGYVLGLAGRRKESIRQFERTLEIDPLFTPTRVVLAWRLIAEGRFEEGRAAFERWAELTGKDPEQVSQVVLLVRRHAETGEPQSIPETLDVDAVVPPFSRARFYLLIGQREKTLEILEKGYAEGAFGVVSSMASPEFDRLRSDPRFIALARKTGLD